MSAPGLTSEAQLRYIIQWFTEFSELQREDFLPILAAARGGHPDLLAATLANMTCQDKPVSLFQCRIKLFNEWYPTWAEEEQDRLVKSVSETDPEFGEKLHEMIANGLNGLQVNGEMNGTNEAHSPDHEEKQEAEPNVNGADDPEDVEAAPALAESIPVEIAAAS